MKKNSLKNIVRNNKGSITSLVTVTIIFFIVIISSAYVISAIQRKAQLKSQLTTKATYENEIANAGNIYKSMTAERGTATPADVLSGKTFYSSIDGTLQTGTLDISTSIDVSDANATESQVLEGATFYAGDNTRKTGTLKLADITPATAASNEIFEGKTAWVNGTKITGTLLDRSSVGKNGCIGINSDYSSVALYPNAKNLQRTTALDGKTYIAMQVPQGIYNGQTYVGVLESEIKNLVGSNVTKIYDYSASLPGDDNTNYSGSNFIVDLKTLYPSTYTSFTTSNFYFIATTIYGFSDNDNGSELRPGINVTWSYDSRTGFLTVSNLGCSIGGGDDAEVKITAGYVIIVL